MSAPAKRNSWPGRPRARRTARGPDRAGLCTYFAAVAFGSGAFDSSSYLAWHAALACDFFSRKQAMTLSMLTRDELHSLNTSGMHVAWSVPEGSAGYPALRAQTGSCYGTPLDLPLHHPNFGILAKHRLRAHPGSLDLWRGICSKSPEHDTDHGEADECSNGRCVAFEVASQATVTTDPRERSFDDPPFG